MEEMLHQWQGRYHKIYRKYISSGAGFLPYSRDYRIAFEWVFWQHTTSDSRRIATNATQRCKTWTTASDVFPKPIGHLDREQLMAFGAVYLVPKRYSFLILRSRLGKGGRKKHNSLTWRSNWKETMNRSICGWVETPTISRVWSTDLMHLVVADSILSDQVSECLRYF